MLANKQSWYFSIKPLYSLVMVFAICICMLAAFWQYQKSLFFLAPAAEQVHIQGRYLNEFTHFLDNQTLNGRAGYAVITPFEYESSIYLVNRGFIGFKDRDHMPSVAKVNGQVTLLGLMKNNNKPLLLNVSLHDPFESRIQYINGRYFSSITHKKVVEEIFHLKEGEGLLEIQPEKAPYLSHHRHNAYAMQWLFLAIAGFIILVVSSITIIPISKVEQE